MAKQEGKKRGFFSKLFGADEKERKPKNDGQPSGDNFIFDDTARVWRPDAMEYMTDWEYTDWYEGYYYDPDKPY